MIANRNTRQRANAGGSAAEIPIWPTVATLANLGCGLLALVCCLRADGARGADPSGGDAWGGNGAVAGAYLVLLALVFDGLDGRIARLTRQVSSFGKQLDSLADMVTFGVAPVVLLVAYCWQVSAGDYAWIGWRAVLCASLVYTACAAIRLSRFNAEAAPGGVFAGLPVPAAAAGVVSLVLLQEPSWWTPAVVSANTVGWLGGVAIAVLSICVATLMVARIRYAHVGQWSARGRTAFAAVGVGGVVLVVGVVFSPHLAIATASWAYILVGGWWCRPRSVRSVQAEPLERKHKTRTQSN